MFLATFAMVMALAAADPPPMAAGATSADASQTPPAQPAPSQKPKKDDANKVICEETAVVGSTIPRRVCHTKAEWDRRSHDDQQEMRRIQDAGGNISE